MQPRCLCVRDDDDAAGWAWIRLFLSDKVHHTIHAIASARDICIYIYNVG